MFPSIDNISGLEAVKSILEARQDQFRHTACIIEALKLCLQCKNSIFNNKHFLQTVHKGGSSAAATSKMERFVIIVNGWKPLTIITKHSILDLAAALDPPVQHKVLRLRDLGFKMSMVLGKRKSKFRSQ